MEIGSKTKQFRTCQTYRSRRVSRKFSFLSRCSTSHDFSIAVSWNQVDFWGKCMSFERVKKKKRCYCVCLLFLRFSGYFFEKMSDALMRRAKQTKERKMMACKIVGEKNLIRVNWWTVCVMIFYASLAHAISINDAKQASHGRKKPAYDLFVLAFWN